MKISKYSVPQWFYAAIAVTPLVLVSALLWWVANQAVKTSSLVELLANLSATGVLEKPGVADLALDAIGSGSSEIVLLSVVVGIVALSGLILLVTQPSPRAKADFSITP